MAYSNYPDDVLPIPSASYSFSVEPATQRYEMDSGRNRQQKRFTSQYHNVDLQWQFNDSELSFFKSWYNGALRNGTDWFSGKFAFGGGVKQNLAQFTGGYSVTHYGFLNWRVSAKVQLEDINEIDNQTDLESAGAPLGLVGTAWVDVLPPPQVAYSFSIESSNARTEIATARYSNRKRFHRNLHVVGIQWKLSDSEMEFFKGWHRVILGLGSLPFDLDLAFGDGLKANTAAIQNGGFTASYQLSADGGVWTVSASVEVDAVNENTTWEQYLAEYSESASLIPPANLPSTIVPIEAQYQRVDLQKAFYSSQDGFNTLSLPLNMRHSKFNTQGSIVTGFKWLKLSASTYSTTN